MKYTLNFIDDRFGSYVPDDIFDTWEEAAESKEKWEELTYQCFEQSVKDGCRYDGEDEKECLEALREEIEENIEIEEIIEDEDEEDEELED